jgi:hypothetical protein
MQHTSMVNCGSDGSGLSLGFGEVDGGGSLCPHRGFALVQLSHLGVEGCLLIGRLIEVLSCPPLSVDLSGVVSCLLLLLVSLLFMGKELHS